MRFIDRRFLLLLFAFTLLLAGTAQAVPDIEHWQTDNGARVYFVHAPQLPMVDVRVVFAGGSSRDEGQPGLAVLTNAMLSEGAGELDTDAISECFESLGARFGSSALRDMAYVSLRSLNRPELLEPALDTFTLVLTRPSFPEAAFERERARVLVGLQQQEQSPSDIAEKAFYRNLYGEHPYATPSLGTVESVGALKRQELIDFYRRYYVARNAVVAIVGDVDRAQAEKMAERVVGPLPAGQPAAALPAAGLPEEGRQVTQVFPSSQTHILVGHPGKSRTDPDYFPLYVGNHILGGSGLVSRISQAVREDRGLAYSAYSYFSPMAAEGPFIMGLQTGNDTAEEGLAVLRETLARFITEGPTEEELDRAKRNITGGFPLRIDSNSDILSYLAVIGFYGLPLDYLDRFNERVEAVTVEAIRDAFRRRVDPARMITVLVGGTAG